MKELWAAYPRDPRYLVSTFGRVRGPKKAGDLKLRYTNDGYVSAGPGLVHRMVLETFIGPCPDGCEASHINHVRHDNRLDNLTWLSVKENRDQRNFKGEKNPGAKLTQQCVDKIRQDSRKQKEIADDYGVSVATISMVKSGKTW